MHAAGAEAYIFGGRRGGGFTMGIDTLDELHCLPLGRSGGAWTDEIEVIGPASS